MAAQLKGQSTWDAAAKASREADAKALYDEHKLRPDDVIRFPKAPGSTSKVQGKPLSVAPDGSITCSAGGKIRAVLPERIEVQTRGPRGGLVWTPLVPGKED